MSLRWRLALALALLAAVATTTAGVISYRTTRDRLVSELDRSLIAAAATFERPGRPNAPDRDDPFTQYVLTEWNLDGELTDGADGDVLSAREAAVIGSPDRAVTGTRSDDGTSYRYLTVGTPRGAVRVGRAMTETDNVLGGLRRGITIIVAVITVAAAALGALIAGSLTRPLRRLTRAADEVGRTGRLDVPIGPSGDDEVGRLAGSFGRMLDTLGRSRDAQQRLVQDAGHELRTPLTSLRTNLDVLRRHPDLDARARDEVVADLGAETDELAALVNELVAVASGDNDDEPASRIELGSLARRLAERSERRSGRPVTVIADDSAVVASPGGLQRALSNLLDNANKFDSSGAPIELRVEAGTISVSDRGPGIDPADLDRVFDRFHRAAAARTLPGSGLGLAIVADFAHRHGGTVFATNRPDGGATVGLHLPPP